MKSIIQFSMKNSVVVFILILMLTGGGVYSLSQMKMEQYPSIDIPYLHLNIIYPGSSPAQVMNDIGKPVEQELSNIDGLDILYSSANPNVFYATLKFTVSTDMDKAEQAARDALGKLKLPETAKSPQFSREMIDADVYTVALHGGSQEQMKQYVEETLKPKLRSIKGIDQINIAGLQDKKIYIKLHTDDLKAYNLTYDIVHQTIMASSLSLPIGDLKTADQTLPIRVDNVLKSLEDVENIQLIAAANPEAAGTAGASGLALKTIRLADIADITYETQATEITRLNGETAAVLSIVPEGGEDAVAIAKQVKAYVSDSDLPKGFKKTVLLDRSVGIEKSVNSMLREVLLGALMAVIVTFIFLRNWRSTLIAVISIPLSMFASIIILNRLGYTLNIMTLAGIAVAIGRVVDDSIVVIENIFRRVRLSAIRDAELVEEATREVSRAITSSTITTVAVFLPLAFVPGLVGKFFVPLAWTIVVSLLFSLLVAVTVVPLMSRLFLLNLKHVEHRENAIQQVYRSLLHWALSHRAWTLIIAVALLLGSVTFIAPQLGINFLPSEKIESYSVQISMPIGTKLSKTDEVAGKVEAILMQHKEIDWVDTRVYSENSWLTLSLKEETENADDLTKELRKQFAGIEGANTITLVGIGSIGGSSDFQLIINGPNQAAINQASEQMVTVLEEVRGLVNVRSSVEGVKPEISIKLDDLALAENGLTPADTALALHQMVNSAVISNIQINEKTVDLVLSLNMDQVNSIELLKEQKLTNRLGEQVLIKDIGQVILTNNPTSIKYLNQNSYVELFATITDTNTGKVTSEAENAIKALKLPKGVTWNSEGASKELNEGFINMGMALLLSIFLVYIVMLIAFGEALVPFVILFAIPFSVIGALLGLYLVGEPIGMPALIGALMLNGIVVTNAIVLLDRVRSNVQGGMANHQALMEAGVTRVRPILMTAIATIGALLPLAVSTDAGLISRSLAVVVIGGLTTSTFLTLIIVPVLYSLFHRNGDRNRSVSSPA